MTESSKPFDRALATEQQRYEESVRQVAESLQREFSTGSAADDSTEEKLAVLRDALAVMRDLAERIERLNAVAEAARRHAAAGAPEDEAEARRAVVAALEELDRNLPRPGGMS